MASAPRYLSGGTVKRKLRLGRGRSEILSSLFFLASLAAKRMSYFGGADYTASKAGVLGFTRHLAFELAPDRIIVNAVCPGLTVTPLAESAARPGELELLAKRIPLGRLVLPGHIAGAVLFYCSARAQILTIPDHRTVKPGLLRRLIRDA